MAPDDRERRGEDDEEGALEPGLGVPEGGAVPRGIDDPGGIGRALRGGRVVDRQEGGNREALVPHRRGGRSAWWAASSASFGRSWGSRRSEEPPPRRRARRRPGPRAWRSSPGTRAAPALIGAAIASGTALASLVAFGHFGAERREAGPAGAPRLRRHVLRPARPGRRGRRRGGPLPGERGRLRDRLLRARTSSFTAIEGSYVSALGRRMGKPA